MPTTVRKATKDDAEQIAEIIEEVRGEPALSFLSSIGALVPLTNPDTSFELPIYQEQE